MERIIIQVEREELGELDEVAAEDATSRAAVVRQAIALFLGERRRSRELGDVVGSYEEQPPEDLLPAPEAQRRAWPA